MFVALVEIDDYSHTRTTAECSRLIGVFHGSKEWVLVTNLTESTTTELRSDRRQWRVNGCQVRQWVGWKEKEWPRTRGGPSKAAEMETKRLRDNVPSVTLGHIYTFCELFGHCTLDAACDSNYKPSHRYQAKPSATRHSTQSGPQRNG